MTELDTLISRVRELKGPDREVDALIAQAFGDVYGLHGYGDEKVEIARRYTASLDATASLIERELPEALWDVNGYGAAAIYPHWLTGDVETKYPETGHTPTLALLLAFLTAIKERDKEVELDAQSWAIDYCR